MSVHQASRRAHVLAAVAALLWGAPWTVPWSLGAGWSDSHTEAEPLCISGGGSGALWLVQVDGVARELALTPGQIQQFARWADELRAQMRRFRAEVLGNQSVDPDRTVAERGRDVAAVEEAFHRRVVARLDRAQQVRLDELYVRYLGPRALFEPRVVARLGLSSAQQEALRDAVRAGARPPEEELLKHLTGPQREHLSTLLGRPFTFPKPRFIQVQPGETRGER